ncbi:MAG: MobF family relaxase, partial [Acidimicrobiia bacterium]
ALEELAGAGEAPEVPGAYLLAGRRAAAGGRGGHRGFRWAVPQDEVDRLRDARRPPDARAGWDVVLRPPKSYSVLWAVGGADLGAALVDIHHRAVADALAYLEDTAATARTTATVGGRRKRVRTAAGGFVVAAFDHRDSRAGDPLLHTHCVVANATRLADGRWAGVDPAGLFRHGLAADAVYQASFRHLAERRLGLASQAVVRGWADVDGVPRAVVEHFSKRSEEIAAELERVGSDSPAARQIAALATRAAKGLREGDADLHARWRAEAAGVGFGPAQVAACLGRTAGAELSAGDVEATFDHLAGPDGLTATAATFSRAEVIAALAGAVGGAVDGEGLVALADRFLASGRAVAVREHRPGMPRPRLLDAPGGAFVDHLADAAFTTPDLAAVEARLMAAAGAGGGPRVDAAVISSAVAARPALSGEQAAMARAVCASPARIRAVVGYPGAGKTYATEAVVAALRSAGVAVVGCAVTAEAADELGRGSGLAGACDTVARTLGDLDHPEYGGLRPGSVVIVDEASTVGHRDLERLLSHVEAAGGALVLIGDPHQHAAVGPGNFFSWLVGRPGGAVAALRANHRQRDQVADDGTVVVSMAAERAAIEAFRDGRVAESFARRDAAGLVTRARSAPALYDAMAADWLAGWRAGERDPLVTTRNATRAALNARCRRLLDEAGGLSGPALAAAGSEFRAGDYVVARRNQRRLRCGADPSFWVRNGARGSVRAVDAGAGTLLVDFDGPDGEARPVRLPAWYVGGGFVEHAYAVTDYGVQGRTLTRSRAVLDDATTAAGAYVATTRGRRENRVYLVDGTLPEAHDADTSHGPPATREATYDALAARLAASVPGALLHQIDPGVADAGALAAAHSLGQLHAALAPLAAVLSSGPPDVSRRIAGAERSAEALLARRQLAAEALAVAPRPGRGRRHRRAAAARRAEVADLDRSLAALERRLAGLRADAARRERWRAEHADEFARAGLLREAIAGREARVRLAAAEVVPEPLRRLLPPVPGAGRDERQARRAVAEKAALYLDRWGATPDAGLLAAGGGDPLVAALGPRPVDPEAAADWDGVAAAVAEAGLAAARSAGAFPVPSP